MGSAAGDGVTLQINLAPSDLPTVVHTLPHQLRQLGGQVNDIDLTLDLHRSSRGRFAEDWEERRPGMNRFLAEVVDQWPSARVCEVDYSEQARAAVNRAFLGGAEVPRKARGGEAMYSYLWGFLEARHDCVLHLDADMMLGGGSQTWVREAVRLLDGREDVVLCSPLAGPPTPDGELPAHVVEGIHRWRGVFLGREPDPPLAYRLGHSSTRIWLARRSRFIAAVCPLRLLRSPWRKRARARLDGNPPYENLEETITEAMLRTGRVRIDYLGEAPGMWSLHPLWRSPAFFDALPGLIERVEMGDMPDEQLGDYDVGDSLVDWSSVHAERERPVSRRERIAWKLKLARALLRRDPT
jgi:hypothetical protein